MIKGDQKYWKWLYVTNCSLNKAKQRKTGRNRSKQAKCAQKWAFYLWLVLYFQFLEFKSWTYKFFMNAELLHFFQHLYLLEWKFQSSKFMLLKKGSFAWAVELLQKWSLCNFILQCRGPYMEHSKIRNHMCKCTGAKLVSLIFNFHSLVSHFI